jgi:ubiquinone/menaquinone biosynthesis C-methylase UbiE
MLIIAIAILALIGLAWWLLITTEGVYLGQRVVTWLYDLYARRYDRIKEYQPDYEHYLLAVPIMGEIAPNKYPFVLDVATGTGRLPLALCQHPDFEGVIVATDISRKMLLQAAEKLAEQRKEGQVVLMRCAGEHLPFPDDTFDVVTCLEALEFTSDQARVVRECARVLRPGGLLLLSNRINTFMPRRLRTDEQLLGLLADCGIGIAQVEAWQTDYNRVWGVKDEAFEG